MCCDDRCHLKTYACNPARSKLTRTANHLASLNYVIDWMHFKCHGGSDVIARLFCMPSCSLELQTSSLIVCEHFHMKFIEYDVCMLDYVAASYAKVYISITLYHRVAKGRARALWAGYAPVIYLCWQRVDLQKHELKPLLPCIKYVFLSLENRSHPKSGPCGPILPLILFRPDQFSPEKQVRAWNFGPLSGIYRFPEFLYCLSGVVPDKYIFTWSYPLINHM